MACTCYPCPILYVIKLLKLQKSMFEPSQSFALSAYFHFPPTIVFAISGRDSPFQPGLLGGFFLTLRTKKYHNTRQNRLNIKEI